MLRPAAGVCPVQAVVVTGRAAPLRSPRAVDGEVAPVAEDAGAVAREAVAVLRASSEDSIALARTGMGSFAVSRTKPMSWQVSTSTLASGCNNVLLQADLCTLGRQTSIVSCHNDRLHD